jgi:predicted DNA-binding transcriptional regulator AlpA
MRPRRDALAANNGAAEMKPERPDAPPDNRLWSVSDLAAWLAVAPATAYRVAAEPGFPRSVRIGKSCRRWVPAEVKRWVERRRG